MTKTETVATRALVPACVERRPHQLVVYAPNSSHKPLRTIPDMSNPSGNDPQVPETAPADKPMRIRNGPSQNKYFQ